VADIASEYPAEIIGIRIDRLMAEPQRDHGAI
jgi:hypothetical protein